MVSLSQLKASLDGAKQPYDVFEYDGDVRLILAEYGGRLYGPFVGEKSLTWANSALEDPTRYADLVASADWNLGGERVWISPEIQYNIGDRNDFWGTHNVPKAIDPGNYTLDGHTLATQMELQAFNIASGSVQLSIKREVMRSPNPLRALHNADELMADVTFAGYSQEIQLVQENDSNLLSESWNLVQLNPGGRLYIPVTGGVEATVYFGDPPAQTRNAPTGAVKINITGQQQFKLGYKAAYLTGRMGYHNTVDDGRDYLMVRSYFNDPASVYPEEPPAQPGVNGYAVHVYNDGGQLGGFGEMECNGRTIGGDTGRTRSTDTFTMWVYIGAKDKLAAIANVLLGVTL